MKEILSIFRQSQLRGIIWIVLIAMSIVTAVTMLFKGTYFDAFQQVGLAYIFYWVDQVEKELTRRNVAASAIGN